MQKRKKKKIIIAILLLLIIGLLLYLLLWSDQSEPGGGGTGQPDPIFPFSGGDPGGGYFDDDDGTGDDDDDSSTYTPRPDLWQISDRPVAGSQWVTNDAGEAEVWYVHRENGHLFSHSTEERESTRLTNTTIPRLQEALISPQGDYIIYRYIDASTDNVKTYKADLIPSNTDDVAYDTEGRFWADNITSVNLSPQGDRIFYLRPTSDGAVGVVMNITTDESVVTFESGLSEWRTEWPTAASILVFNRPAQNTQSFSHLIDAETGRMDKLAEGYGMTTTISPDTEYVLTSKLENNQYRSHLYSASNTQSSLMTIPTFSEKCGWQQDGSVFFCGIPTEDFPNPTLRSWYQGVNNFTDEMHIFVPSDRQQENLFGDEEMEMGPFDIIDINVGPNFNFISFENKRDHILWGLQL